MRKQRYKINQLIKNAGSSSFLISFKGIKTKIVFRNLQVRVYNAIIKSSSIIRLRDLDTNQHPKDVLIKGLRSLRTIIGTIWNQSTNV